MTRLKFLFLSAIFLFSVETLYSQEKPDISLEEVRSDRVNFINRTRRPATRAARLKEIKTGQDLATPINEGKTKINLNGIAFQRVFDPETAGFGADIIILNPRANYGHINALHRVLSGYISSTFEYELNQADTLARYILYYNAHHRKDQGGISKKYSPNVVSSLDPEKIGLDVNYRNWSGKSQIIIPLKKNIVRPNGTDLNNGELEITVGEEGTADEQDKMEKIQEERKQEDLQKLDDKEQELTKKEETLKQEEQKLQQEEKQTQKEIQKTDKKITELKKDPVKNKTAIKQEEAKKQNLEQKQQQTAQKQETVKQEQTKVAEQKQEVASQKQETQTGQTASTPPAADPQTAAKIEKLEKENQDLKAQEQAREEKSENVVGEKILFMRVMQTTEDNHFHSELWAIDTLNDDALFRSPYQNICGREFTVLPDQGVLVIGFPGDPAHSSEHRMVILDDQALTVKKEGTDTVYFRTPVKLMDNKIYVIGIHENMYHLTRLNPDLTLDTRSEIPVSSNSQITFTKDKIYLTGKKNNGNTQITVLKRNDLTHLKTFEPKEPPRTGASNVP
ncbi:MAG: hypothetical protein OEZ34_00105 [Spirochaetia bacterium]|nr:hypothetical protein [Spirochaetia bacterium]